MLGFLFGLVLGVVITSIGFIVWGKKNKNKIEAARTALINEYDKLPADLRTKLHDLLN